MGQSGAFGARWHMLIGEYSHTIDAKNRISLPSKFRRELGRNVVMTRGLDNCIFVFSTKEWKRISEKVHELPIGQADTRGFARFLLAGASEAEVDSAGRVLVPEFLRAFAGLREKVVVAGMHSRVELWGEKRWGEYKKRIERQGDALAEKLGEIGMI